MRKLMIGATALFTALAGHAEEKRPNIVVITTDDMGIEIGAYGDGQARTPAMDKLAEQGVLFEKAFCSQSSCSPARSTIVSGLWPHQSGQIGLEQFGYFMKAGTKTLFHWLKDAGYYTGWFGKVHVGLADGESWEDVWDVHPFGAPFTTKVEKMAEYAEGFIKEAGDRPFLLYYNLVDPHAPFHDQIEGEPQNPRGPDDVEPWPWLGISGARPNQLVASYYNCVERADRGIGFLMDVLDTTGTAENTLVIFVSDGGAGFPRAKTHNYDAGARIPFIVRWPGKIKAGLRRDDLVSLIDIVPTVLDACGLDIPESLPGASVLSLCRGENPDWRKVVFTEHTAHCPHQYFPRRTAFDGRYLLIWNLEGGERENPFPYGDIRSKVIFDLVQQKKEGSDIDGAMDRALEPPQFELIDVQNDPAELHNLADNPEYAPKLEELKSAIEEWQEKTDDPLRIPENLKLMSEWHDELAATEEPKDERGRPPFVQHDYVRPRYKALLEKLKD